MRRVQKVLVICLLYGNDWVRFEDRMGLLSDEETASSLKGKTKLMTDQVNDNFEQILTLITVCMPYPSGEVVELYAHRWEIELSIVKNEA